ncbi:hypothetical protein SAY87_008586 [Trapa incisa]|nr:hypothetical protein SAY87_008586 [Trapa incisa]
MQNYTLRNGNHSVGESSSSTSLSSQPGVDDDHMIAAVLTEEYANLDGAVARKLSNLAPVPHIPRINSYIPNISDASLDHQRLLQRYMFAAKICLLTSFRDTCFIEIVPRSEAPKHEFWLSFWSEVHYNSIYELRDAPITHKPRKKHWLF